MVVLLIRVMFEDDIEGPDHIQMAQNGQDHLPT